MNKPSTMKSISMATAIAAALAFGAAAQAQTPPTPMTNDSKMAAPVTGNMAKTPEERTEGKEMKKSHKAAKKAAKSSDATSPQGTNSGASKTGDNAMPKSKGDGSGKS